MLHALQQQPWVSPLERERDGDRTVHVDATTLEAGPRVGGGANGPPAV